MLNDPFYKQSLSYSYWPGLAKKKKKHTHAGILSTNLFLLRLCLGLEAADLLLGQRHSIFLLLGGPQPELEVCHLPLKLHDPGALRHRGYLQQNI